MRRQALALLMTTVLVGCVNVEPNPRDAGMCSGSYGCGKAPPTVPGLQDAYGNKVAMAAPYSSAPPSSPWAAARMMSNSMPLNAMQMSGMTPPGMSGPGGTLPQTMLPSGGLLSPPGVPFAPGMPAGSGVMPASFNPGAGMMPGGHAGMPSSPMMPFAAPGMPPGASGVIQANVPPGNMPPGGSGIQLAQYLGGSPGANPWGQRYSSQRTQVKFNRPAGMKVFWFSQGPDGKPTYSTTPIETPGRWNFPQAAIYRLKLTNIEGRPELEVYPTMEVVPSSPRTEAFLSHSAVPVEFTAEDFKQIVDGNYVVKVVYLPDPQFQDVAGTGTDEILSTRLEPGTDPIQEARRRGSVLLIIRMGNVHQELEHSPPLNAPGSGQAGKGAGADMPILHPNMTPGPGFGPDYPNKPLMQVPYYGMPGGYCPPGAMPSPSGAVPGGGTPPQSGPKMPPATGFNPQFNPGANNGPADYLPPAGNTLPPTRSGPTGPGSFPFGAGQSLPPTPSPSAPAPIAPVPPLPTPAAPGAGASVQPPAPPAPPPGALSGPPSSLSAPTRSAVAPRQTSPAGPPAGSTPFLNGTSKTVIRRPSIYDPAGGSWSPESSKTDKAPALPPTITPSEAPKTVPAIPVSSGSTPPVTTPEQGPTPAPVTPAPTFVPGPGEIPLPPLSNSSSAEPTPAGPSTSAASLPSAPNASVVPEPKFPGAPGSVTAPPAPATTKTEPSAPTQLPPVTSLAPLPSDAAPQAKAPAVDPKSTPAFPPTPGEIRPAPTSSTVPATSQAAPASAGVVPAADRGVAPRRSDDLAVPPKEFRLP